MKRRTEHPTGVTASAARLRRLGGVGLITLLAAAIVVSAAAGRPGESVKSARGAVCGPLFTWSEGSRELSAQLGDQAAVFLRPSAGGQQALPRLVRASPRAGEGAVAAFERTRRELLSKPDVASVGAVLYRGSRTAAHRLIVTGDLIVRLHQGVPAGQRRLLFAGAGVSEVRPFPFAPGAFLLEASSPLQVFAAARKLAASPLVDWATPSFRRTRTARAIPDDTLFASQWHLRNTGSLGGLAGVDLNVTPVWDSLRGSPSEVIALVDDGVQIRHADIAPNVVAGASYDWVDGDTDPSPQDAPEEGWYEDHGTACAGAAAACGFNARGVAGVAPAAGLVGYRFMKVADDAVEAEALGNVRAGIFDNRDLVDVSSNSWGPWDDRHLEGPGPLVEAALEAGVTSGRGGKGTVYVWAAGNGRWNYDNVNFDGFANSRYTIAVGAVGIGGKVAPYSEDGAALMVCAPSGGGGAGITTTDRGGLQGYSPNSYTDDFSGTSAAAPQAAGVVALILQANPELSWRDVQQILMTTARKVDPASSSWTSNAAGYQVSHTYGFGLIDAAAAVTAALSWVPVGPEVSVERTAEPALPIPDADATGVSSSVTLDASEQALRVEYVEVEFTAPHSYWSDLEVVLLSPSGTRSVLAPASLLADPDTSDYGSGWRFGSARHLGESSRGTWTLLVRDRQAGDTGVFASWTLRLFGTALGTDTEPPVTTLSGASRTWWCTPPALRLSAVDLGSNVRRTEYRIDGGGDDPFTEGASILVPAPRTDHVNDGPHQIWYRSADNAEPENVESARSVMVHIDTRRPRTYAPRRASVRRGAVVRLYYRVEDDGYSSGRASVALRIRDAAGRLRKTISVPARSVGVLRYAAFRCRLPRGTYRFSVRARDTAGNAQTRTGTNRLLVR